MIRLAYFSQATMDLTTSELEQILQVSRRNNAASDITGILVYHNRAFLQVLEGPKQAVLDCFERVQRDPRHADVHSVKIMEANTRAFSIWSMGLGDPENMQQMPDDSLKSLDEIQLRLSEVTGMDITSGKRAVAVLLLKFLRGLTQA